MKPANSPRPSLPQDLDEQQRAFRAFQLSLCRTNYTPSVSPLDQDGTPSANMRDRMDAHHKNASCAGCHQVFEPLGIALENFDAMGRFREQDGGEPVNPSGTFADGASWLELGQFKQQLSQYQDGFDSNVTTVLLSYALGRTRHNSDSTSTPGRFLHPGENAGSPDYSARCRGERLFLVLNYRGDYQEPAISDEDGSSLTRFAQKVHSGRVLTVKNGRSQNANHGYVQYDGRRGSDDSFVLHWRGCRVRFWAAAPDRLTQ